MILGPFTHSVNFAVSWFYFGKTGIYSRWLDYFRIVFLVKVSGGFPLCYCCYLHSIHVASSGVNCLFLAALSGVFKTHSSKFASAFWWDDCVYSFLYCSIPFVFSCLFLALGQSKRGCVKSQYWWSYRVLSWEYRSNSHKFLGWRLQ